MINTETAQTIHTTVAEQSTYYPIGFQYDVLPDTGVPELLVTLDGAPLTYGTDYTVNVAGLQLVNAPEVGQVLTIKRDVAFTQEIDLQTGFISPDQIESGLDRAVMRDQELKRNVLDVAAALAEEQEERREADTGLQDAINAKQDIIVDLAAIRAGASTGATAVQPGDLATVATSGSYNDLSNKPTIPIPGTGVITIKQGGVTKGSFNVNQSGDQEIELDQGGGGDVESVNGKTGVVVLTAADVGAATAAQGAKADTAVQPGSLATVATTGSYNDLSNKPTIPAAQVNSDWSANSGVAQILNKPTLGTAAAANTTDFATAAQGAKADTAVQPAAISDMETATHAAATYATKAELTTGLATKSGVTFRTWGANE